MKRLSTKQKLHHQSRAVKKARRRATHEIRARRYSEEVQARFERLAIRRRNEVSEWGLASHVRRALFEDQIRRGLQRLGAAA